jgi:glycosyltransferase involved in cell wall biosynthesis
VIEDGVTGLLVENSQISIVGALERVLRDRPFAQAISIAAYERVAKDFSADAMVDGTLAVYRRVLG